VSNKKPNFYPVILAGGRGTRFWPLSRKRRAKQLLALDGKQTMIQQTVVRLLPLASPHKLRIISNEDLRREIARQLPKLNQHQIIAEPLGRNTAPAIGLAAFILLRTDRTAVLGLFPSDQVIGDQTRFRQIVRRGIEVAAAGENIVVLGIRPARAETGYGYIEAGQPTDDTAVLHVRRFTEKPDAVNAMEFVRAGNYYWNSGIFLWSAQTLVNALREYLPKTAAVLEQIAAAFGTRKFASTLHRLYSKCDNISVDYAVLEPRSAKGEQASKIYCIPSDFGWNDLGSWTALHEHHAAQHDPVSNLISSEGVFTLHAEGNYIHAPGKFVAAVNVSNLVVVETDDALLITTREHAQNVGQIVKYLDEQKLHKLV
jgi:mannose-1-phosphate guanylyltransferase